MIPFTLTCLALIAYCAYREWGFTRERREWRSEREKLLDRIQAPELAALPALEPVAYVAPDDDEGWWAAQEERES